MMTSSEYTKKIKTGMTFLHGLSAGALISATSFYLAFDNWKPMVWSACIIVLLESTIHLVKAFG